MMTTEIEAKTVVLGSQGVGKTCVVRRCVENVFEENVASTIGAAFSSHKVYIDGHRVHLQIWDTAGQERFKAMAPMYYRKASVAILVYDITDIESFHALKGWVKELNQNVDRTVAMILFGNKCDLEAERQVSKEVAESYAAGIGAEIVEMSALSNKGVAEGFDRIAAVVLNKLDDSHAQVLSRIPSCTNGTVRNTSVSSDTSQLPQGRGCSC